MKAELIDSMGTDLTVVNAARVSMDKESEYDTAIAWSYDRNEDGKVIRSYKEKLLLAGDKKLLSYLAREGHWTPFSHPQICMRETVPIFVARQRFKHMVGFTYNEVSRRYVDTPPKFYTPDVWRSRPEGSIKQGSGSGEVDELIWEYFGGHTAQQPIGEVYSSVMSGCTILYQDMIENGVAPEQARMVLPQSMYTSYYVTGSLSAWARAYKQRIDVHAQVEIQDLAVQWDAIIEPLFPESWKVLTS